MAIAALSKLGSGVTRLAWIGPTLARLTLGVVFVQTGWGKLHALQKVTAFFAELGIPAAAFNAHLVATTELVCGSLLLVGLFARLAALPLMVTMVVALATAKQAEISSVPDLLGELEWSYLVLLAWIAVAGAGPISVDGWWSARQELHLRSSAPEADALA